MIHASRLPRTLLSVRMERKAAQYSNTVLFLAITFPRYNFTDEIMREKMRGILC